MWFLKHASRQTDRHTVTLIAVLQPPTRGRSGDSVNEFGGNDEIRCYEIMNQTRMWANAQRDGRPAEHKWRPLFNAAKFG